MHFAVCLFIGSSVEKKGKFFFFFLVLLGVGAAQEAQKSYYLGGLLTTYCKTSC